MTGETKPCVCVWTVQVHLSVVRKLARVEFCVELFIHIKFELHVARPTRRFAMLSSLCMQISG